jgi:hypothetical protein
VLDFWDSKKANTERNIQPILDHLRHVLRESCSIATLDGTEIVYIARANVTRIMVDRFESGKPPEGTASLRARSGAAAGASRTSHTKTTRGAQLVSIRVSGNKNVPTSKKQTFA